MKKVICLLIALCVTVCALTACGGSFSGVKDYGGEVSSNGGFAVAKGDYVYFINGSSESTAENNFGSVVKGALVRAKLADVKKFGEETACEVVIPKLIYTDYDTSKSGVYIFGDYVYYVTPSASKDKTGAVKNTVAEFTRTRLDGTNTTVIASVSGLDTPYKFVANGDDVYLTVYTTETNDDGEEENLLITYDVKGKEVARSLALSAYIFPDEYDGKLAYYKKTAHNEERDEDEDFDEIYSYDLTGKGGVKVLSGAGMYSDENGIGTQGVTFNLIKLTGDTLYLSETYVDTSVSTITRYYGVKTSDLTENTAHGKLTLLNKGTTEASQIFASTSVYYSLDKILYNDSTYGIVVYDYNKQDDVKSFGIDLCLYSSDLMSYTYCYDDGEYMYYYGNNYYYRISIEDVLAGNENIHQITYTPTSGTSDFFRFEIFDNAIMILNTYDPLYNYVCAYDINKVDSIEPAEGQEKKDAISEFLTEFATSDREHVLARLKYRVAVVTDDDKEAVETYLKNNYPETSASS